MFGLVNDPYFVLLILFCAAAITIGALVTARLVMLGVVFVSEHVDRCLGRRAGWRAVNLAKVSC